LLFGVRRSCFLLRWFDCLGLRRAFHHRFGEGFWGLGGFLTFWFGGLFGLLCRVLHLEFPRLKEKGSFFCGESRGEFDLLAAGESFEGIKKAYPNITDEDIRACLLYASILADEEAGVTAA